MCITLSFHYIIHFCKSQYSYALYRPRSILSLQNTHILCYNFRMQANIWETLPENFTILAPMEGVTDIIFRQVIAHAGHPNLFFTEFTNVSSFASEKGRNNALERLEIAPSDTPIIAQIWGKNPEHFHMLAGELEQLGFSGLDINMGCPDRHVNAAGGGAAMIRTPELALECLRQAREATRLPVSIKTRLGYTYIDEYREWLPKILHEHPAALTVHLRTRKEMSKVPAHYELIPEIASLREKISPSTKLVINGDIKNLQDIAALRSQYSNAKVDGWMIGRGVFENPYCFTSHTPTQAQLFQLLRLHLDLFDQTSKATLTKYGHSLSFEPLKHYFKIYVNNYDGAKELRAQLMQCHNTDEARNLIS